MKEAQHPRVGVSKCWLKLEAPRQLVSLIKVWDQGADVSIPETQEGEFHSFLLAPKVEDKHRRRYECGEDLITAEHWIALIPSAHTLKLGDPCAERNVPRTQRCHV